MLAYQKKISQVKHLFNYSEEETLETMIDFMFYSLTFQKENLEKIKSDLTQEQKKALEELLITFGKDSENHKFQDILGDYLLEVKRSKKAKQFSGEFYTPDPICDFMAEATINFKKEDIEKAIKEKRPLTVLEPSLGSGRMLLSTGKVLKRKFPQYELHEYLLTTGIDINIHAVKMSAINLSLWGIPSILIHANALLKTPKEAIEEGNFYVNLPYMLLCKKINQNPEKLSKEIKEITKKEIKARQKSIFEFA